MNKILDLQLKDYIEENIIPRYVQYESAHNDFHIRKVIENSLNLIEDLDVDINMVYTIAAYHDIGIKDGRDNHHLSSAIYLMQDKNLNKWFDERQLEIMKQAIEDHRASSSNPPRSIYGRIISEADRDIEPDRIIERCVKYQIAHYPDNSKDEIFDLAKKHIIEKYGENGYLKLWLNSIANQEGLDTIRAWIADNELDNILRQNIENLVSNSFGN